MPRLVGRDACLCAVTPDQRTGPVWQSHGACRRARVLATANGEDLGRRHGRHWLARRSVADLSREELEGKRVLLRTDLNVAVGGARLGRDDLYILRAAARTMRVLLDAGARLVVASHWQAPKAPSSSPAAHVQRLIADALRAELGAPVACSASYGGPEVIDLLERVGGGGERRGSTGGRGLVFLPSLGCNPAEAANSEDFARRLAWKMDVFVNDAHKATA